MDKTIGNKLVITAAFSSLSIDAFIAMSEENPLQITAEAKNKKAIIKISGVIWEYNNSARSFERQIDALVEQGITDAHVFINTPGGDVFQANEIANQIEKFTGTLTGEGGALVASAGTYIAMSLSSFEMPQNGQWMYHKPSGYMRGNEDKISSELKLLQAFTKDYKARYAEMSIHSEAEIEAKWSKGDVWLTAKEAKKQGFITGVKSRTKITSQDASLITACGAPTKPKVTTTNNKPEKPHEMDLKIAAVKIGLPETATQAEYDAAILAMQNKANKAEQLERTAKEKESIKTAADIKAMFDNAIEQKKITAKQAENMESWAEKDLAACKAYLEALEALEKPKTRPKASATGVKGIEGKKFEELTEKQAAELEESDPETFNALYEAYCNQ